MQSCDQFGLWKLYIGYAKIQAKTNLRYCMVGKGLNTLTNAQVRFMLNEHQVITSKRDLYTTSATRKKGSKWHRMGQAQLPIQ